MKDTLHTGLAAGITERIIGCGIEVHRIFGPGLLESAYEAAFCVELKLAGLAFNRQIGVPVLYKGELVAEYRPDLIVAETVIVEIKSVERLDAIHTAQMLTYLRITGLRVGLILNFNSAVLRNGIRRIAL